MERVTTLAGQITEDEFVRDWTKQNAVIRELEVLGEAAGRVSNEFSSNHPEIPWREITGLRHKLIHDYFEVDLGIVWGTATTNVPRVLPLLETALADFPE